MQSILITGANEKTREETALKTAAGQSSKFDTVIVDTHEEKGIAAARAITEVVSRKPFESRVTTVIVKKAENLTIPAQNALLKTLEEPNAACQIILTASSSDNLLPTVVSRCLEVSLTPVKTDRKNPKYFDKTFSENLEKIEKAGLDNLIGDWQEILKENVKNPQNSNYPLNVLHRYNKTLLRLKKAEKLSANKKLLFLFATLELPKKSK